MMSLLTGQLAVLKADGFARLHPKASAWLVWEPGNWESPRSETESNTGVTRFPLLKDPSGPEDGDALCFELTVTADEKLRIGRATGCDIILNDMTVSREQFELFHCEGFWAVLSSLGATTFVGDAEASRAIALRDQTVIRAGGLRLSFYKPASLLERLRAGG
jgi:hypothetical protein